MSIREEDYIFKMDFIIGEMRALVEGALLLCEEDLPTLDKLSSRQRVLEATQTLNAIVSVLGALRIRLCDLQKEYIQIAQCWDTEDSQSS